MLGVDGTIRGNVLEVRGEQNRRVEKVLVDMGFDKNNISFC
jgi:translation initiation factor 1 (eIF-1/SUI1)